MRAARLDDLDDTTRGLARVFLLLASLSAGPLVAAARGQGRALGWRLEGERELEPIDETQNVIPAGGQGRGQSPEWSEWFESKAPANLLIGTERGPQWWSRPQGDERDGERNNNQSWLLCQSGGLLDEYCALDGNARGPVCASNGRLYKSPCELARATCQLGVRLCRVSDLSRCSRGWPFQAAPGDESTGLCSRTAYRRFRLALWREFNSSTEVLFKHLDRNGDGRLEARELWPRLAPTGAADDSREHEERDNNENDDDDDDDDDDNDGDHHGVQEGQEEREKQTETSVCDEADQRGGEFVFEHHFDWSPCSLSHLLVYEGRPDTMAGGAHPNNERQLTRAQFARIFEQLGGPSTETQTPPTPPSHKHRAPAEPVESTLTTSELIMQMGESSLIDCQPGWPAGFGTAAQLELACRWTRLGVDLASIRDDPHVAIVGADQKQAPKLRLLDAQLYLSGVYKCSCQSRARANQIRASKLPRLSHEVRVQVLAQPRVSVRPRFQWSLPGSRVAFECHHDHIDTSPSRPTARTKTATTDEWQTRIRWFQGELPIRLPDSDGRPSNDSHAAACSSRASTGLAADTERRRRLELESVQVEDSGPFTCRVDVTRPAAGNASRCQAEGSGRLLIQGQPNIGQLGGGTGTSHLWSFHEAGLSIFRLRSEDGQELELVRELAGQSAVSEQVDGNWNQLTLCGGLSPEQMVICEWSDNAVLVEVPQPAATSTTSEAPTQTTTPPPSRKYIYVGQPNLNRVLVFDGRAAELVAVVNTEPQPRRLFAYWPNKIHLSKWVRRRLGPLASLRWLQALEYHQHHQHHHQHHHHQQAAATPYLHQRAGGQGAGANHLAQSQAHPLELTPKSSRLYSDRGSPGEAAEAARLGGEPRSAGASKRAASDNNDDGGGDRAHDRDRPDNVGRFRRHLRGTLDSHAAWPRGEQTNDRPAEPVGATASTAPQRSLLAHPPRLVQYDIWLLCDGKPLVVDAQSDLSDLPPAQAELDFSPTAASFRRGAAQTETESQQQQQQQRWHQHRGTEALYRINRLRRRRVKDDRHDEDDGSPGAANNQTSAWTERAGPELANSLPACPGGKEARLRNRKSVQIIQSTFLPGRARAPHRVHHHHYNQQQQQQQINDTARPADWLPLAGSASSALNEFRRLTVLTTHHVIAATAYPGELLNALGPLARHFAAPPTRALGDLVQDLAVPEVPYSQASNPHFKLHHAYVSHFGEPRLYRVAMDTYRYDREIRLERRAANAGDGGEPCEPLAMLPAVQGLLIIQCRAPITRRPSGQLVIDELTSGRVQFNAQIKAQRGHLTPDSRYLISILTNELLAASRPPANNTEDNRDSRRQEGEQRRGEEEAQQTSSVIYVQSVRAAPSGLEFMYEIKTSLEIAQCSFVWRDGYYAAIFVALNRRDQLTELLSLRLADGRLELIVRVPGLAESQATWSHHKEPLSVHQDQQVASLGTPEGLYFVDLDENRLIAGPLTSQNIQRQRQSTTLPTQLWVVNE